MKLKILQKWVSEDSSSQTQKRFLADRKVTNELPSIMTDKKKAGHLLLTESLAFFLES